MPPPKLSLTSEALAKEDNNAAKIINYSDSAKVLKGCTDKPGLTGRQITI
jgi:hypothetical protein